MKVRVLPVGNSRQPPTIGNDKSNEHEEGKRLRPVKLSALVAGGADLQCGSLDVLAVALVVLLGVVFLFLDAWSVEWARSSPQTFFFSHLIKDEQPRRVCGF